jgi:Arc/MetJ-type ribon-helix-helix transcriptional regulator
MTEREVAAIVEPLVRSRAFASAEDAIRTLVRDYILRQIQHYSDRLAALEKGHGMSFEQFSAYLKERSALLANGHLDPEQKRRVAQAVMVEEEEWLDWKIAREFLESWLGLKAEASL